MSTHHTGMPTTYITQVNMHVKQAKTDLNLISMTDLSCWYVADMYLYLRDFQLFFYYLNELQLSMLAPISIQI